MTEWSGRRIRLTASRSAGCEGSHPRKKPL
ncbi:MAG: hypothetical protein J07HX5_00968, partial [halophilic archaeon J07HX5]